MFDNAYICEVNLCIANQFLDKIYKDFENGIPIDSIDLSHIVLAKYHYEIVLSCHGGY